MRTLLTVGRLRQAYLAFYVAEGTAVVMSGVLTVVTIGVLMAGVGHTAIHVHSVHMMHSVWSLIVFLAGLQPAHALRDALLTH